MDAPEVDHPAGRLLLEYRELQKKLGTYLETYPSFVHPKTGRIHANFLQCRVPTGRLACTNPNIQQIPHEDEFRRCFVAEEGYVLVIADYSQIELRILAEVSDDPAFVHAFQNGEDLHRVTAATMYGVPIDDVTKEAAHGGQADKLRPDGRGREVSQPSSARTRSGRQLQTSTSPTTRRCSASCNARPTVAGPRAAHSPVSGSSATSPWPTTAGRCAARL